MEADTCRPLWRGWRWWAWWGARRGARRGGGGRRWRRAPISWRQAYFDWRWRGQIIPLYNTSGKVALSHGVWNVSFTKSMIMAFAIVSWLGLLFIRALMYFFVKLHTLSSLLARAESPMCDVSNFADNIPESNENDPPARTALIRKNKKIGMIWSININ